MSEVTPIVDDAEMLRAYAEMIRLKDAEIEQLKRDQDTLLASLVAAFKEIEELRENEAH
ncbi:MAG TPA: hypothetical protein VN957_27350 [Chthoniobacterales bacterium]|nr:hypothetical protein [Chthoniobacterales bacterium]